MTPGTPMAGPDAMGRPSRIRDVWIEARAAVGTSTSVALGNVTERDLGRFEASVAGSLLDGKGGFASPLYLSAVLAWGPGPQERDLLPDGAAPDPFAGVDLAGLRLMAGGQDVRFHRDVDPDLPITAQVELASAELKETRSGWLLVLAVDRRYADEQGVLLECRETFLAREATA